jgi:erythronate-4-phosphate dehydrogenase
VLLNDPPRERAAAARGEPSLFVSLDRLLAESDIVTLHVPLTHEGPDATRQMAGDAFFARMKRGSLFLNSARGPVVLVDALHRALDAGIVAHAVIDTWDPEPAFPASLMERVDLGTPHIAGYSFEGKVNGTFFVYREACDFLGVAPAWEPSALFASGGAELALPAHFRLAEGALHEVVRQVYNIEEDDAALRSGCAGDAQARAKHFDGLRKHYRNRREFPSARIVYSGADPSLRDCLRYLGFRIE